MRALVALLFPHRWKGPLAQAERLLASDAPIAGDGRPPPEGIGAKLDAWLASPAWELRNAAVKLIAKLRDEARYPRLLAALCDRSEAGIVRRNAAEAVARLGLSTAEARAALLRALADRYWEVRSEAAAALAALFPPAEDIELALLHLLCGKRGHSTFRTEKLNVPFSKLRIREENFEVRMAAAAALGCLGASRAALDVLLALAGDDSWLVRSQAAVAIAHFVGRQPDLFPEARGRLLGVDRLSEGCVSYFVHREVLGRVLSLVEEGPQALSAEALRPLYLSPKAGWNRVSR